MQKTSRIAVISLLALLQLFAPLVHAHAGGGQFSGGMHVPGLEFLAKRDTDTARSFTSLGEYLGVIVSQAYGIDTRGNHGNSAPDPEIALPFPVVRATSKEPGLNGFFQAYPFPFALQNWLKPAPRAPPKLA